MPFGAVQVARFAVRMESEINKGFGENFYFTGLLVGTGVVAGVGRTQCEFFGPREILPSA